MSDFNIVVAHFGHHNRVVMTDTLYQYDYGQQLKIEGITALPQTFQAHFSNVQHGGVSITVTGINGMVDVPNSLLMTGKRVYCWIYVTETGSGETVYQILMPVQSRPMPEYYDVEDVGVFDSVVNQVAGYAATATTGATSATASATAAAGSEAAAAASASAAANSAENAAASEANAEASASAAQASDASAATAATTATNKAAEAAQSATSAGSAADRAEAAQDAAETAQEAAETAATSATADAATASTKATAAAASATTASTKATDATNAATTATAQAVAAEAAKTTAVEAKTAAQSAQTAAETAATTATAKATEAAASATAAAQAAASINTPDSALSDTSTNAVQNKVITGEITDVKTAIDANLLSPNIAGIGYGVMYRLDPPIKVGEKFTIKTIDGEALGRYADYAWYDSSGAEISHKRFYNVTVEQTVTVATSDAYYFKWLTQPAKLMSIVRGDTAGTSVEYFRPYSDFAPGMTAADDDYYKQRISYPYSFTEHHALLVNGSLANYSEYYNTTSLIPIKMGDVLHYRLCARSDESLINVYSTSGAFIASAAQGAGNSTMVEGTYTMPIDGYVIAVNRFYNVQTEETYFYINDSIFHKVSYGVEQAEAKANTALSGYGTLEGWEPHAKAFSEMAINTADAESFMFVTDSHFMSKTTESEWKAYLYDIASYWEKLYYASPCSFFLHGGDWLGTGEVRTSAIYKLSVLGGLFKSKFDKFALLVGNHESGNQMIISENDSGSAVMTHDTLANTLLRNFPNTYYLYKANTFHMYCFDSWVSGAEDSFSKEQIHWFAQSLMTEEAAHIVIAIHILYNGEVLQYLGNTLTLCADAYNNRTSFAFDGETYDFSNAAGDGNVSFVIAGHNHADAMGTVNNIPYIMTVNASEYGNTTWTNLPLPCDLMQIDWNSKKLYAYRAARGATGTIRELTIL